MRPRSRRPSPAILVAILALLAALGGTAVAGGLSAAKHKTPGDTKADTKLFGKLIKKSAPNLSVKHSASSDSATHSASSDSATHAAGAANADKLGGTDAGAYQRRVLRSGEVEVGIWEVSGSGTGVAAYLSGSIVFNPPLAADLCDADCTSHVQFQAEGTTSAACPGFGQAVAGVLCIYETVNAGLTFNDASIDPEGLNDVVRRYGTIIYYKAAGGGTGGYARGQWVLKAP